MPMKGEQEFNPLSCYFLLDGGRRLSRAAHNQVPGVSIEDHLGMVTCGRYGTNTRWSITINLECTGEPHQAEQCVIRDSHAFALRLCADLTRSKKLHTHHRWIRAARRDAWRLVSGEILADISLSEAGAGAIGQLWTYRDRRDAIWVVIYRRAWIRWWARLSWQYLPRFC